MKKLFLLTVLLLAFSLVACRSETGTPTAIPTEVAPISEPEIEEVESPAELVMISANDLTGTTWAWIGFTDPVQQFAVDNPQNYTITFQEDGTVVVVADCNNALGSYTVDESSLMIEMGPMTMALCPGESRSEDFVKYLGAAAIFFFEDSTLYIDLMADGGTMSFIPVETVIADDGRGAIAGQLTANPWKWVSFTNPVEQFEIDDPENFLLTFNEDGTINIKADCNNALGNYTVDGSSLEVEVGPMTKALCPGESRSEEFVQYLGFAAIYFFEDGDLFIDLFADGGTMQFSPYTGESAMETSLATEFSPQSEPLFANIYLGGGETLWLDPSLVSIRSGTVEGSGVDASTLGEGCTGWIPTQPDVVFNWEEHEGLDTLKVFTISLGDPTLVLVTPSGEVLCADDFNPLVLDPMIELKDPEVGRYAAFIGSFENDAVEPGFLVITSHDIDPARMDLAQMFPRHIDPRATNETLSIDVLELDSPSAVEPKNGTLSPADLAFQQALTGGGEIGAFNLDHENHTCTGFISAAPSFRFEWSGDLEQLVFFFESNQDTTLKILAPDGTFHCDDDYHGSENLNPWLSLTPIAGTYNVWIGSFSPDVVVEGTLTVTADADATPVQLASKDINN